MIEIEKKFLLTDSQKDALLDGANLVSEKVVTDSYMDDDAYSLTLADFWLRDRDGAYELKAPLKTGAGSYVTTNQYHEIDDIQEIAQTLGLTFEHDFETTLSRAGIAKFATCYSHRNSYEKDGFHIDVDEVTFDDTDFTYALSEIELLIEDESQAAEAERRIMEFATKLGLTTDQVVLGKVGAYLKEARPKHYAALVAAGVLK